MQLRIIGIILRNKVRQLWKGVISAYEKAYQREEFAQVGNQRAKQKREAQARCSHAHRDGNSHCVNVRTPVHNEDIWYILCQECQFKFTNCSNPALLASGVVYDPKLFEKVFKQLEVVVDRLMSPSSVLTFPCGVVMSMQPIPQTGVPLTRDEMSIMDSIPFDILRTLSTEELDKRLGRVS